MLECSRHLYVLILAHSAFVTFVCRSVLDSDHTHFILMAHFIRRFIIINIIIIAVGCEHKREL